MKGDGNLYIVYDSNYTKSSSAHVFPLVHWKC